VPPRCPAAIFAVLLFVAGCATSRPQIDWAAAPCDSRGVLVAINGAGDFEAASDALKEAVTEQQLPLTVAVFHWSHGYLRAIADQVDRSHAQDEGRRLASILCSWRQCQPHAEIDVIAHSAGCAVVLAAGDVLPPGSLDRVILLAPSVSECYDLRPTLRACRKSVDVFYSERDRFFLGVGTAVLGTADRRWCVGAAGRIGFEPLVCTPEDGPLYCKLRQHAWSRAAIEAGNRGGHYGSYQPGYLRTYVLPVLGDR
jgi:hypothetical protein